MNAKRRAALSFVASVVLVSGVAAGTPGKDATPPLIRWAVRTDAPAAEDVPLVECTQVSYAVDVYGGTAVGTLTYAFSNGSAETVTARFASTLPSPVEVLGLALVSQGRLEDLAVEPVVTERTTPPRTARPDPRRPEAPPAPAVSRMRSAPFQIEARSTFEMHMRFRVPLSVERGIFGLTLPALQPEPATDRRRPSPPRTVLESVSVSVHQDAPLVAPASATHEILVDYLGDRTVIEPVARQFPASEAFSLTFATGSEKEPTLAARVQRDGEEGHTVEVVVDPPREPETTASRAKQVLFVIDSSGSMAMKDKLEQARRAVGRALDSLQPSDRFNLIEFDDDYHLMRPAPVEPLAEGKDGVKRWLAGLTADGGTKLLPALEAALEQPDDPERHGILVVVTDGILSDEEPVLRLLKERLGERRLFVVGPGPLVRAETLLRLAEYGRGAASFFGESDSLEQAVDDLCASIAHPLAWDLRLDWDGGEVTEITPSRFPDLYAGRPVRVLAHVRGDLPSSLAVSVNTVDGERRYRVALPPVQ
ncbi:MAG TPA: VWA domain-containing protein [Candidatus Polarisedimenticolaceae bacterium]|nr:VWA domain-containing protein [Candidatus Polarisedimenticolaceae bacterium]